MIEPSDHRPALGYKIGLCNQFKAHFAQQSLQILAKSYENLDIDRTRGFES